MTTAQAEARPDSAPIKATPVRHPGRWIASLIIAVLVAMLVHTLVTNQRFGWSVVGDYLTSRSILEGLLRTLELTAIAMIGAIILGVILAVMRLSPNPIVSSTSSVYIWFFRGTPLLVQVIFWFNLSAIYPRLSIGVPFGPGFVGGSSNSLITPMIAASLALILNESAYMAEIVRAGILSVDHGQVEAAQALGMTRAVTMRRIILPQAMRVIIPPTGNETISMLKTSSLASVITVTELLYAVQLIYSVNFKTIPLLLVASLWYLIATSVLTIGQYYVERHYARGSARALPPTPLQRLRRYLFTVHSELPAPAADAGEAP
jgi:polar amino acid transport system permease protein